MCGRSPLGQSVAGKPARRTLAVQRVLVLNEDD